MADKRAVGHAYNIDFLNVVFAASSLFVLFSTVWMVWDDYDREWKNYQRQFSQLEMEVTRLGLEQAQADVDQTRLAELTAARQTAGQQAGSSVDQVVELESQLAEVERQLFVATQNFQFFKANYDVDRYAFEVDREEAHAEHPDEEVEFEGEDEIAAQHEEWVALGLEVEALEAQRQDLRDQIGAITAEVDTLDDQLAELMGETDRLQGLVGDLQPSLIDDYLLNAPMLDFMAPSYKIDKVVTPKLKEPLNFMDVERVHRCKTCHINIDDPAPRFVGLQDEKWGSVYASHPRLDLFLAAASPHNYLDIGCTTCHYGDGHAVDFSIAAHTPVDEEQKKHWEGRYHWHEKHHDDYPMLPAYFTSVTTISGRSREPGS